MMFEIRFANVEQINIVLQGLAKLPYELSAGVIETVRNQAQQQFTHMSSQDATVTASVNGSTDVVDSAD
jgi:hypothetical protein